MSKLHKIINPDILQYTQLYPLQIQNSIGIEARYRNAKAYPLTSFLLHIPMNPLMPRHEKRWQTRTDPLWWSAVAHKEFASQSVVRSWAARRIRAAFVESLRKKGWAPDGRPLLGSGQRKLLYGTLQMATRRGSDPKVSVEQLAKETDSIVEEIIRRQGSKPYFQQASKPKRKSTDPVNRKQPKIAAP